MRTVFAMSAVLALAVSARGDVFSSEFRALPSEEGWELVAPPCGVSPAIENGHYVQLLDPQARSTSPVRAQEIYARTPGDFYSTAGQFLEFRVQTNGRLSGSCYETPTEFIVSTTFG
ncbi:MAG: hypothetical protein IH897_08345, partial [Planctomycetes bacterium]|nr:hypothetical protein [Planctomycetota bacterium]